MEVWGEGGKSPRETAPLRCQVAQKCTGAEVCREGGWGPSAAMTCDERIKECRHHTVVELSLLLGLLIFLSSWKPSTPLS